MIILFRGALLSLPMPTLFEISLAYSLLLGSAPFGLVAAVLFIGPSVNMPSLLVGARSAGTSEPAFGARTCLGRTKNPLNALLFLTAFSKKQ
jgi:hypothetical protein